MNLFSSGSFSSETCWGDSHRLSKSDDMLQIECLTSYLLEKQTQRTYYVVLTTAELHVPNPVHHDKRVRIEDQSSVRRVLPKMVCDTWFIRRTYLYTVLHIIRRLKTNFYVEHGKIRILQNMCCSMSFIKNHNSGLSCVSVRKFSQIRWTHVNFKLHHEFIKIQSLIRLHRLLQLSSHRIKKYVLTKFRAMFTLS